MNRMSQKEIFYYYIQNKITSFTNEQLKGDYNLFLKSYPDLQTFSHAFQLDNIMSHQFNFNNDDYKIIIKNITKLYQENNQYVNSNQIVKQYENKNTEKPKTKTKKIPEKKIAGFVDILIISIITGTFIGIILLNIYSKIIEHI